MSRQSPFPRVRASEHTVTKNDKVRKALAGHGDNGRAVRHVLHFLFHDDDATFTEAAMAEELRGLGFEVDLAKCRNGVIAEEYREVASTDFDETTEALSQFARARGWQYDGFECAVEIAD
ncbi:MAG: hypothetical protein GC150_01000 [Rhizobiales bacterium]|nr:hypothetical protein [Hyphomicrobiales bacterium]